MASEDAFITVCTKQPVQKGHRFGPFTGRLRVWGIDENVKLGSWKIYPREEGEKVYNLSTADPTVPQWLHLIKTTQDAEQSNMVVVQTGLKFYFEMTKDIDEGVEYSLMGRKSEQNPVEPTHVVKPPPKIRKPRKKLTPEERQSKKEQQRKELLERLCCPSTRERSRRCIECGEKFTSAILFMKHRGKCGLLKDDDLLTESSDEGSENTEDEMAREEDEEEDDDISQDETSRDTNTTLEDPGKEGDPQTVELHQRKLAQDVDQLIAGITAEGVGTEDEENEARKSDDQPTIANPLLEQLEIAVVAPEPTPEPADEPSPGQQPVAAKRPRGRPRKDGLPPIQRKKPGRKKRRKRRRPLEDGDHQPMKQPKDECIPTLPNPSLYPFFCTTCSKVFPTESWFDYHVEQHGDPTLCYLVCSICDLAFRFLTEHTLHMEGTHQLDNRDLILSEKFRCDLCKKAFRSPIHLERHRRRAAAEEPLPKGPVQIKCKFCEKSFSMEVGLENHTRKHHPLVQRYQCTENDCLQTFPSKEDRAEHLEVFHMTGSRQIYKCPVDQCTKAYTSMAALNYHYELRHTGGSRPFQCEMCGKRWVKIGKLREHYKTHSTEKNELCDICGKAYKTRPELKDHHAELHTEEGKIKLQCRFCPAYFSRRSSRSYHERRHKNEFPYVCPKPGCNKRFIAVIDFKRHLIYHTGAKLYRCRFCNNCFTRNDYLKGHERKHSLLGEKLNPDPPIEETVTIKVPWPMPKPVKIAGQNVVVIIEPDPTLADDNHCDNEAMSAVETLHEGDGTQTAMLLRTDSSGQPILTPMEDGMQQSTDILQQAIEHDNSHDQPLQLLPFTTTNAGQAITYVQGNSASAAIQEAVLQAMNQQQHQQQSGSSDAAATTHQILLHTGGGGEEATAAFLQQAIDGGNCCGTQIMQTTTSEQAALMLQQLAASGAQVVFQPSAGCTDGGTSATTMQATLQGENGETSIVMVNLGTDMVTNDVAEVEAMDVENPDQTDQTTHVVVSQADVIPTTGDLLDSGSGVILVDDVVTEEKQPDVLDQEDAEMLMIAEQLEKGGIVRVEQV